MSENASCAIGNLFNFVEEWEYNTVLLSRSKQRNRVS